MARVVAPALRNAPIRTSTAGPRVAAISASSPEASMPATAAPRPVARPTKRPAPHPQSSTVVPGLMCARSITCSYTGVPNRRALPTSPPRLTRERRTGPPPCPAAHDTGAWLLSAVPVAGRACRPNVPGTDGQVPRDGRTVASVILPKCFGSPPPSRRMSRCTHPAAAGSIATIQPEPGDQTRA